MSIVWWEEDLMARLKQGPATAEEIGKLLHAYGPDAVVRVRERGIPLVVVGHLPPKGQHKKGGSQRNLYALEELNVKYSARREGLVLMKYVSCAKGVG